MFVLQTSLALKAFTLRLIQLVSFTTSKINLQPWANLNLARGSKLTLYILYKASAGFLSRLCWIPLPVPMFSFYLVLFYWMCKVVFANIVRKDMRNFSNSIFRFTKDLWYNRLPLDPQSNGEFFARVIFPCL